MFEDSTFESTGRIRTRSRGWMIATFVLNSSIVLVLILIPLIYTQALPHADLSFIMEIPPPPPPTPPPARELERTTARPVDMADPMAAPRQIPKGIVIPTEPDPPSVGINDSADLAAATPGGTGPGDVFRAQPQPRIFHPDVKGPIHLTSTLAQGLLIRKVVPQYPALGRAVRAQGTVVLAATISKDGTIANLRVLSGPPILQQAAIDAVSQWRYRPYLLNGSPVDVETTVNVVFTLGS